MIHSKIKFFVLSLFFISILLPSQIFAQKVKAEVTVILEKLPLEKREKLNDFQEKLMVYMNNYPYCEDEYQTDFSVKVQIYLTDASVSYEDRYRGTLLIANNSDIQFYDKRWRFKYDAFEPLLVDEAQFHPLTSVIDFYVYLLLGGELDKYGKFAGTPLFKNASNINEQARFSKFIDGWDERRILMDQIVAQENKPYREALDSYFLGISNSNEDFASTRKHCKAAITMIAELIQTNPSYELPKQFIDGHRTEIINIFKDDPDYRDMFELLIKIDSDHEADYKDYL
jgi:hypothetical protein